jgi:hypothetical protein
MVEYTGPSGTTYIYDEAWGDLIRFRKSWALMPPQYRDGTRDTVHFPIRPHHRAHIGQLFWLRYQDLWSRRKVWKGMNAIRVVFNLRGPDG